MTALAIVITLVSTVSWSLFDASRKRLAQRLPAAAAVVWLMLLQTPIFAFLSLSETWTVPGIDYWGPALLSVIVNSFAHVWFITAVSLAPLSLAVPILSLTPVFAALGGFLILGEPTTLRQALGILVIIGATLGLPRSQGVGDVESKKVTKGLLLMVVVAMLWALAPVIDKICLRTVSSSEHAFIQCLAIAGVLAVWMKLKGRALEVAGAKAQLRWLVGAVIFAAAALYFQFWAIQEMPVGIFEALKRSFGLVAAITLGFFLFHEPVTRRKVAVALVMGLGIFLLLA